MRSRSEGLDSRRGDATGGNIREGINHDQVARALFAELCVLLLVLHITACEASAATLSECEPGHEHFCSADEHLWFGACRREKKRVGYAADTANNANVPK
jgi:lauroyl/myristoyl acyltransferase